MNKQSHSRVLPPYGALIAVLVTAFCAACTSRPATAPMTGKNTPHMIVLTAPSDAERSGLHAGSKGAPYQIGFGRVIPAEQRRIVLRDLHWRSVTASGYATTVSVQSQGARSLRAGLRLNKNVPGLEWSFRESSAPVASSALVGDDPYWSPVIDGDTVWIELKAITIPARDVVLEIPLVSHIP